MDAELQINPKNGKWIHFKVVAFISNLSRWRTGANLQKLEFQQNQSLCRHFWRVYVLHAWLQRNIRSNLQEHMYFNSRERCDPIKYKQNHDIIGSYINILIIVLSLKTTILLSRQVYITFNIQCDFLFSLLVEKVELFTELSIFEMVFSKLIYIGRQSLLI